MRDLTKTVSTGILLWNPTAENLHMQYAGRSLTIKPGEKLEVNESCGNHLLNNFGQRGLTYLKYGDDEQTIKEDAIARNLTFKKRMIGEFNQRNEQRKMMGLGYVPPTKKLSEYSVELGIQLLEPYTLKDVEKEAISKAGEENLKLQKENEALKEDMEKIKQMLAKLLEERSSDEKVAKKT